MSHRETMTDMTSFQMLDGLKALLANFVSIGTREKLIVVVVAILEFDGSRGSKNSSVKIIKGHTVLLL